MVNTELIHQQKAHLEEFNLDNKIVGDLTAKFLELVYPSYLVNQHDVEFWLDKDSALHLECMTFSVSAVVPQIMWIRFLKM